MSAHSPTGDHFSGGWGSNMNNSNSEINKDGLDERRSRSPPPPRPSHQRRERVSRSPVRESRYGRSRSRSRSLTRYDRYRPSESSRRSRRDEYSPAARYSRRSRSPYPSRRYRRYSRSPSPRDNNYKSRPSGMNLSYRRSPPRRSLRNDTEGRDTSTSIFVGNIPYHYKEDNLRDLFEKYGKIIAVTIPQDHKVNHNKGICFIEFAERRDAEEAMRATTGLRIDGRNVRLDWDAGAARKNIRLPQTTSSHHSPSDVDVHYTDRRLRSRSRSPSRSPRSRSPPRR